MSLQWRLQFDSGKEGTLRVAQVHGEGACAGAVGLGVGVMAVEARPPIVHHAACALAVLHTLAVAARGFCEACLDVWTYKLLPVTGAGTAACKFLLLGVGAFACHTSSGKTPHPGAGSCCQSPRPVCSRLLKQQVTGTRQQLHSVTTRRFVFVATQGLAWESSTSRASPCRKASMKTRRRLFGRPKPTEHMFSLLTYLTCQ